jgi:hypothetical protein
MQRPTEREFLEAVLKGIDDLPEGFADRLLDLVAEVREDRPEAIRRLIEESAGE